MSASDEVWILGIQMTKFGKHPDLDIVDLAAEAAMGALSDAGVTMADIGVIAAGNLMNANAGIGQQLQKQIVNRMPHADGCQVSAALADCRDRRYWRSGSGQPSLSEGVGERHHR